MTMVSGVVLAAAALTLTACVGAEPLNLSDDSPANAKAPPGFVAAPAALDEYKSAEDFTARAEEDAKAPAMDHSAHGGMNMPGMQMPGMRMPANPAPVQSAPAQGGPAAPHANH